jgi:exonuclease SbcC
LEEFLSFDTEEQNIVSLSRQRRELAGLRADWQPLASGSQATERLAAEAEEREAAAVAEVWRRTSGRELETVLDELRATFPDLPSSASTDPELARSTAVALVDAEIRRCNELVSQDDTIAVQIGQLDQAITRMRARVGIIDEQISRIARDTQDLSRNLAELVPHIHGEDCPVCGRNFSEISSEPLAAHLSGRVARLTEQAGKLQALTAEKANAVATLARTERDRGDAASRQLTQDVRVTQKTRAARLAGAARKLADLARPAAEGAEVLRREAIGRKRLAELRSHDQRATEIRRALTELCAAMAQPTPGETEPIADTIARLEQQVLAEEARLIGLQRSRREALSECRRLHDIETQITTSTAAVSALQKALEALETAFKIAEERRSAAKDIAQAAHTAIVSRVFNESLNAIWRELFIRLAPTEPFVPAFRLPESSDRAVTAILETVHRSGGRGGAPGAMLSAGNLNTAALTLFLALHLSVRARLPWLILDDPVQSMDEVHIAQFAALLRTLSKTHDRQIVIAVHDRQLFEYLALELSPAFESDQLITIELGRSPAGGTIADPSFLDWKPDSAVAA